MPLTDFAQIQTFLDYLKYEKRYAQNTVISYQNDLEQFFQFLKSQFDGPELTAISPLFIRSWLAEMKEDKISSRSLNRKISTLKSFFRYQVKLGSITSTPMSAIVSPKSGKKLPSFVAEQDMENLKANEAEVAGEKSWQQLTDQLVLALFYQTGIRLSELLNLTEANIDVSNKQIKVLGKGNKERIIPVSASLIKQVQEYIHNKHLEFPEITLPQLLVGKQGRALYSKYVYLLVKRHLSTVTTLRKKSPHVLRHTFATHLTNNGAELNAVKELLGHSSLAATQVYTHNTIDKLKNIHKKAHPKA